MERVDILKRSSSRFAFDELIVYCSQIAVFSFATVFASNFLSNEKQLISYMGSKLNESTLSDFGFTLLGIVIVIGLFAIIGAVTTNKAVARYVSELMGDISRLIYFFGSSVAGVMLVSSIYVLNHPKAVEINPEKFLILSIIMAFMVFLIGFSVSYAFKYKTHIINNKMVNINNKENIMNIEFTGVFAPNGVDGIAFKAVMDKTPIICTVSSEALQDIDPANRMSGVEQQFQANQAQFESIARKKLLNGELTDGKVFINTSDLTD